MKEYFILFDEETCRIVQTKTRIRPNGWKLGKDIELGIAESQIL